MSTKINVSTLRGSRFMNAYNRSTDYCLRHVYGRYSSAKACAENECLRKMSDENGHGFKIMSFNSFGFTCGWLTSDGLRVETPSGSYLVA